MSKNRIYLTVSPAMTVALDILAERSGLPRTTQAMTVLRAALDRTIHSAECQDRLRKHNAGRTAKEWAQETWEDHYVETTLQAEAAAAASVEAEL